MKKNTQKGILIFWNDKFPSFKFPKILGLLQPNFAHCLHDLWHFRNYLFMAKLLVSNPLIWRCPQCLLSTPKACTCTPSLHTEALHRQLAVSIYKSSLSNHRISLSPGGLTFLKISFTFQVIEISHRFPQSLILSLSMIFSYHCQHVASKLHRDISSHPSQPIPATYEGFICGCFLSLFLTNILRAKWLFFCT